MFLKDALARTRSASATQLLAIAPAVTQVVMCDELREEVYEQLDRHLGWSTETARAIYGPIFDVWREWPAEEAIAMGQPFETRELVPVLADLARVYIDAVGPRAEQGGKSRVSPVSYGRAPIANSPGSCRPASIPACSAGMQSARRNESASRSP